MCDFVEAVAEQGDLEGLLQFLKNYNLEFYGYDQSDPGFGVYDGQPINCRRHGKTRTFFG